MLTISELPELGELSLQGRGQEAPGSGCTATALLLPQLLQRCCTALHLPTEPAQLEAAQGNTLKYTLKYTPLYLSYGSESPGCSKSGATTQPLQ